jgi:hypothetical protein
MGLGHSGLALGLQEAILEMVGMVDLDYELKVDADDQ